MRRSSAAERAYARRAQRAEFLQHQQPGGHRTGLSALMRLPRSRASFVLVLMALMVAGVAATLWLSTQAIADSYRLEELRQENARLAEEAELLQREVSRLEAPPSVAERAEKLGMAPGGNPARIVVEDDGSIVVIGEPTKVPVPEPSQPQSAEDSESQQEQGATGGD